MSLLEKYMNTSVPSALKENDPVGTTVGGRVVDVKMQQAMSYVPAGSSETSKPMFFDDGKPKENYIVTIQTDLRDPSVEDDDGRRSVHIKMYYKSDREALVDVVRATGDGDVMVGGYFAVTKKGFGTDQYGRPTAWKVYSYEYRKPGASNGALANGNPTPPPTPSAPPAPPQPQPQATTKPAPQAAPATADDPMERVKKLLGHGLSPADVDKLMPGLGVDTITAIQNLL